MTWAKKRETWQMGTSTKLHLVNEGTQVTLCGLALSTWATEFWPSADTRTEWEAGLSLGESCKKCENYRYKQDVLGKDVNPMKSSYVRG